MSSYLGFQPSNDPNAYFVSYNTEDAQRIQPIVCKLRELGVPLWYDYGLEYGEKWSTQIAMHIDACRAVILFFSRDILLKENSFVRKEYQMAKDFYEKKVYVVLLDNIAKRDVPHHMVAWWIDILSEQNIVAYNTALDEDFCRSLARAIGAQIQELSHEPIPEPTPEPLPEPMPEPVPEPVPEPAPAPAPTIENWKLVLQRQQAQSEQAPPKEPISAASESNSPATSWKSILKKAACEFLDLPESAPQPTTVPAAPMPAPKLQNIWICGNCSAENSSNYGQCKKCGTFRTG